MSDASRIHDGEQPGEEHFAVGLSADLSQACAGDLRSEPRDVRHGAVVGEDPAAAEGVRVEQRHLAHCLLTNVGNEHLTAAADGETMEPLVLAGAGGPAIDVPPSAIGVEHCDAPPVPMFTRKRGQRAGIHAEGS